MITGPKSNAEAHHKKYGVSFEEAATVFSDINALTKTDATHPERYTIIGLSSKARLLRVTYEFEGNENIRIITARKASPAKRREYEGGH